MDMTWTVDIDVNAPLERVFDAAVDQHQVMAWSAWPAATGYSCAVQEQDGRALGATIVFTDPRSGEPAGRQELAATVAPTYVRYELHNPGPGGVMLHPVVEVHLAALDPDRTRVFWRFANQLPEGMPEEAQQQMASWVKGLHVKDLEGLKEHVEHR